MIEGPFDTIYSSLPRSLISVRNREIAESTPAAPAQACFLGWSAGVR
jgi:hypothetical protein